MSRTYQKKVINRPAPAFSRAQQGWTVPVDTDTLKEWITLAEHDLKLWKNELHNRENAGRFEAIAQVRNILHLWEALGTPIAMSDIVNKSGNPIKPRAKRGSKK